MFSTNFMVDRPTNRGLFKKSASLELHGYCFQWKRRAYLRGFRLKIQPNGTLILTTSESPNLHEIEKWVLEKHDWILKVLNKLETLRLQHPAPMFSQNEELPFKGGTLKIKYSPQVSPQIKMQIEGDQLHVFIPQKEWGERFLIYPQPHLRNAYRKFFRAQAEIEISSRVRAWESKTGLVSKKIQFKEMTSLWGSCSADGSIRLNWKLIAAPLEVIDSVIVHELAHLKQSGHGHRFWKLVEEFLPQAKLQNRWLSRNQFVFDFLSKESDLYSTKIK